MHIFKSRNPIWLLLDIAIMIWLWKSEVYVAAVFFTIDTIIQICYTFLPDMVDQWDKKKGYRVFYTLFLLIALFFVTRHILTLGIV